MRRQNLALVLQEVAAGAPLSRAEVAAASGLTRAAVSSLVEELIGAGLLAELGPAPSGRVGRPGTALTLNPQGPAGLGAEIGVEHLAACVVDLRGEARVWTRIAADNRGRPAAEVLADLAALLRTVAAEAAPALRPAGLGIAVPGLVGAEPGLVRRAANLGWSDVPVIALLRSELRLAGAPDLAALPAEVDNEANLGGLAELWLGDHAGTGDFVHISAEAGIGAALIVAGRLFRGARGFAGELGHVPVEPDGPPCACGSRGCLEQYAGERAVLRAAGPGSARADTGHSSGEAGSGRDWIALLADRAADGDPAVLAALDRAGTALGTAVAGAVNLIDPASVILGGGYAELGEWLLPGMRRELTARVTVRPWSDDWLAVSVLGRRGPLLGAAAGVVRAIVEDPGRFAAQ
ncbi:ROK family transcriptional regulator [Peterkaempfera bronchialis]|uniref:ROK family transcriptional regulator n=1 Tax=Peterkaempfera bronchialis TaxID=2126346 RepID=A0A345T6E5_9ACTN|nr:ROK family transcriptional regulator [Peterkaempfera bronchialis]AXI81550.1 ROK family transcriptional regulator [Peterkaempfera bronchialis]